MYLIIQYKCIILTFTESPHPHSLMNKKIGPSLRLIKILIDTNYRNSILHWQLSNILMGNLLVSQLHPVNPGLHLQVYLSPSCMQVPPFSHGFTLSHLAIKIKKGLYFNVNNIYNICSLVYCAPYEERNSPWSNLKTS